LFNNWFFYCYFCRFLNFWHRFCDLFRSWNNFCVRLFSLRLVKKLLRLLRPSLDVKHHQVVFRSLHCFAIKSSTELYGKFKDPLGKGYTLNQLIGFSHLEGFWFKQLKIVFAVFISCKIENKVPLVYSGLGHAIVVNEGAS